MPLSSLALNSSCVFSHRSRELLRVGLNDFEEKNHKSFEPALNNHVICGSFFVCLVTAHFNHNHNITTTSPTHIIHHQPPRTMYHDHDHDDHDDQQRQQHQQHRRCPPPPPLHDELGGLGLETRRISSPGMFFLYIYCFL